MRRVLRRLAVPPSVNVIPGTRFVGRSGHRTLDGVGSSAGATPSTSSTKAAQAQPPPPTKSSFGMDRSVAPPPPPPSNPLENLNLNQIIDRVKIKDITQDDENILLELATKRIKSGQSSLEEIVNYAEICKNKKLKQPILDILLDLPLEKLPETSEVCGHIIQLIRITGESELYPAVLFDWASIRGHLFNPTSMSYFLFECGRHGLRCKHFADGLVPRAAEMANDMNFEELMRATQGLIRFVRDWKSFFDASRMRYQENLENLEDKDWILVLRLCKDLNAHREYRRLQELAVACRPPQELSLTTVASALDRLQKQKTVKLGRSIENFVEGCAGTMHSRREELSELSMVQLVESLDSFSTWVEGRGVIPRAGRTRQSMTTVTPELLNAIGDILAERVSEIKYSPNVWLWARITQAFSRFTHYHKGWMHEITFLARDQFILDKISFFQQQSFVVALARLGFADAEAYERIGDILMREKDLFKEPHTCTPTLWAFTMTNQVHKELFDHLAENLVEWAGDRRTNSICQGLWCLVATGYHQTRDLTPLFDACFTESNRTDPLLKRRLHVIRQIVTTDPNNKYDVPEVEFSMERPSKVAEEAVEWVSGAEIAPTYGPGCLIQFNPNEKYGMLIANDAPLATGDAPMDILLQCRILARQGWRLAPPLFRFSDTYENYGENYVKYWASRSQ